MNFQDTINAHLAMARKQTLANSIQLTLGELLLKAEALMCDHSKKIVKFDIDYYPTNFDSWRGAYEEVALGFDITETNITLDEFYTMISKTIGTEFTGYKGGEYVMNKHTPVWVDNYGNCGNKGVVNLIVVDNDIIIETADCEF